MRGPATVGIALRLKRHGPEVLREDVTDADLFEPLAEVWREEWLRRGRSHVEIGCLRPRLVPLPPARGTACVGYRLEATDPEGHAVSREFTILSLEAVASRGARRLVARGDLREGDTYYYDLAADPGGTSFVSAAADSPGLAASAKTRPVEALSVRLGPLLDRARTIGPQDASTFPVLYTEDVLSRAESLCRRGAEARPPVETGGVLVGSLARCPDTGEAFLLVLDVIEATDARQEQFSLYYSARTWGRIQAVMRAMESRPATRTRRIVGQCHGHNFLPGGGAAPCPACPHLAVCGRTSVFVSPQDADWARAVFRRQPWHVSHIFGLNARAERVHGLFGLLDGRLLERGFHVISDFEETGDSRDAR